MHINYTGKTVLVTGGTSGIGKSTALAFAAAGANVVLTGRREKEGAAVVAAIVEKGGQATFIRADSSRENEVKAAVDRTVALYGRLDAAFNNAGVEAAGPLDQMTEAEYRRVFDINVWGVLSSLKHEIAAMLKTGGGAIVNTSSVVGHVGASHLSVYTASKHAIEGLTKSVALEFATRNIRVNAVAPGTIETEMVDRMISGNDDLRQAFLSLHPIGRFGQGEDVASAVLYLASDAAKFITGTSLSIDGGWRSR
jgi:NAD(P)-dependent dehydrogenase (short-subunit alcohol dehydrogenase family)